jgi:hypothetical protein
MQPCENRAAKPVRLRRRASADLLGAIETIISALVEMAGYDSIASEEFPNYGEETRTCGQLADLQPTIVVCTREDGLTMVKRGRAVFAREYMLQLMETMAGLMAEGKRSLGHARSQLHVPGGAACRRGTQRGTLARPRAVGGKLFPQKGHVLDNCVQRQGYPGRRR